MVNNINEKLILIYNNATSKVGKTFLFVQILVSHAVIIISFMFLTANKTILNVLINMGAILVINEMDEIYGKLLVMHIRTYYNDVINQDDFLKFQCEEKDLEVSYIYCLSFIVVTMVNTIA